MMKIAAVRIDTRDRNRWEARVGGRAVGRAARKETALRIAAQKASEAMRANAGEVA